MKRVLTALVLIPLVLLAVFKAPHWLFTLLVGVVALLALKEYLALVKAYGVVPLRWTSYIIVALTFLAYTTCDKTAGYWMGIAMQVIGMRQNFASVLYYSLYWALPFIFLVPAMRLGELRTAFPSAAASMFGAYYVGISLLCVAHLQAMGWYPLIFTFFAVWAGDIVAMYTGKAIGRHKMSPRISPNKTWEGAIGSIFGSVLACWLLTHFASTIGQWAGGPRGVTYYTPTSVLPPFVAGLLHGPMLFVAAILINIAAQLGDLVESLIKRGANVKDSGSIVPGHGGILDRIDALLFAAPVALILFTFLR